MVRLTGHSFLQPRAVLCEYRQAGEAEGGAVSEEDFRERLAHDSLDAPTSQAFWGMFSGGAGAEVPAHHQNRGPLVVGLIKRMIRRLASVVGEHVPLEPLEGDTLQVAGRHDPVGVDVVAGKWDAASDDLPPNVLLAHRSHSRTSVTSPAMAAAATMEGLMSRVRPVGLPCRPLKFRLLCRGHSISSSMSSPSASVPLSWVH